MISEKNIPPQCGDVSPNSWTMGDFMAYVDALPPGMYWLYCTGPATTNLTNGICTYWMIVQIFKRNDTLINCIGYPSRREFPILQAKKMTTGWDESFAPYATP